VEVDTPFFTELPVLAAGTDPVGRTLTKASAHEATLAPVFG